MGRTSHRRRRGAGQRPGPTDPGAGKLNYGYPGKSAPAEPTRKAKRGRVAKKVRAGQVFVNGYGAGGGIELPFGGFKRSGHGREKGFDALYDMSATKTVAFNHG